MPEKWTEMNDANPVLDDEVWSVPDWLSDEECSHEIGADWRSCRDEAAMGEEE